MLEPPGIIRVVERHATSRTGMTTLARYGLIPSDLRRWTLVPLAGLEPATCCLGDDCQSSGLYGPVGSSQVRLGGVSGECGLVVRHPDVDVDPVALGRGASTCWNQNDGRGRAGRSGPHRAVAAIVGASTARQNGIISGPTSASIVTCTAAQRMCRRGRPVHAPPPRSAGQLNVALQSRHDSSF
jgi:hypothetical protein